MYSIQPHSDISFRLRTNLEQSGLDLMIKKWLSKTSRISQASLINFINHYSHLRFKADYPKDELPVGHIQRIKGISNSQLTHFLHQLKGTIPNYPARCLVFGNALHECILEQDQFILEDYNLRPSEQKTLFKMRRSLALHQPFQSMLASAKKEVVKTWTDKKTGLKCKAKIDLVLHNEELADLKTTSATSQREFLHGLSKYEIDRQAAFYLSSGKSRRFWIIGIQKRPPYQVFMESFYCNSNFIRRGRKKMDFLLGRYLSMGQADEITNNFG